MTHTKSLIASTAIVFSVISTPTVLATPTQPNYEFSLSQGISHEEFHWSINGSPSPNILSELHWRNMRMDQTHLRFDVENKGFFYRFEASYGSISAGRNQDSDFLNDDRQNEFSRSYSDVSGETIDFNLALGYDLHLGKNQAFFFRPMIGISQFEQRLGMHNGIQTIGIVEGNIVPINNAPIPGLDSSYDTDWDTKWLGGELRLRPHHRLQITFNYQYHYDIDYFAVANWNLRSDFRHPVSFTHKAERGDGHIATLRSNVQINPNFQLFMDYSYMTMKAKKGIDTTFSASNTTSSTGLNIAETKSNTLMLGITWTP